MGGVDGLIPRGPVALPTPAALVQFPRRRGGEALVTSEETWAVFAFLSRMVICGGLY